MRLDSTGLIFITNNFTPRILWDHEPSLRNSRRPLLLRQAFRLAALLQVCSLPSVQLKPTPSKLGCSPLVVNVLQALTCLQPIVTYSISKECKIVLRTKTLSLLNTLKILTFKALKKCDSHKRILQIRKAQVQENHLRFFLLILERYQQRSFSKQTARLLDNLNSKFLNIWQAPCGCCISNRCVDIILLQTFCLKFTQQIF